MIFSLLGIKYLYVEKRKIRISLELYFVNKLLVNELLIEIMSSQILQLNNNLLLS